MPGWRARPSGRRTGHVEHTVRYACTAHLPPTHGLCLPTSEQEQAIERAQQQHSGSRALSAEIDMRRDRAEYEVEVMTTDKRIYDIRIDAVNGNVLENREDHDD